MGHPSSQRVLSRIQVKFLPVPPNAEREAHNAQKLGHICAAGELFLAAAYDCCPSLLGGVSHKENALPTNSGSAFE